MTPGHARFPSLWTTSEIKPVQSGNGLGDGAGRVWTCVDNACNLAWISSAGLAIEIWSVINFGPTSHSGPDIVKIWYYINLRSDILHTLVRLSSGSGLISSYGQISRCDLSINLSPDVKLWSKSSSDPMASSSVFWYRALIWYQALVAYRALHMVWHFYLFIFIYLFISQLITIDKNSKQNMNQLTSVQGKCQPCQGT